MHDLEVDGTRVRCQVDTAQLDEVLRHLSAAGVRSLTSQPPTLEELFLRRRLDPRPVAVRRQPGRQHCLAVPDPGRPGPAGQDGRGHRGEPGGGGPAGPGL